MLPNTAPVPGCMPSDAQLRANITPKAQDHSTASGIGSQNGNTQPSGQLQATSSVHDLEQRVPKMDDDENWKDSWFSYFKAHASRILEKNISDIKLLPREYRRLIKENHYGHRAAQYVAWRQSLLTTGGIFFAATTALDAVILADPWRTGTSGDQTFILRHISDRYHTYFDDLIMCNRLYAILLMVASSFSVVAATWSAWYSSTFRISARGVQASFMCSYFPPFLLLLCIPFRHTVDFKGIQKQMCTDVLNQTLLKSSLENMKWPRKSGALAQNLVTVYGIRLPNDFCDQDPNSWGDSIAGMLESGGYLEANGSCPRAENSVKDLAQVSTSIALSSAGMNVSDGSVGATAAEHAGSAAAVGAQAAAKLANSMPESNGKNTTCTEACLNCTTSCLPYLNKLAALSAIYDVNVISKQLSLEISAASSIALSNAGTASAAASNAATAAQMASDSAAKRVDAIHEIAADAPSSQVTLARCTHCFSLDASLRCAWNCPKVQAALARQAISGYMPEEAKMCVKPDDLTSFKLMIELGTQTEYWTMLLGAVFAVLSFSSLLPLTFSLLFGAAKGSSIAKSVIPHSRLPDVVSTSAAVFTFPFIFMVAVLVQTTLWTPLTLVGVLCLLGGIVASMKPGKLEALTHDTFRFHSDLLYKVSMALFATSVVFFGIALGASSLVRSTYKFLKDQGVELSDEDKEHLGSQFITFVVKIAVSTLGKGLISTVFFSDGMVNLMNKFHWGDERDDSLEIQCARMRLVEDIHTLKDEKPSIDEDEGLPGNSDSEEEASERARAAQEAAVHALQSLVHLQSTVVPNQVHPWEDEETNPSTQLPELIRALLSGPLGHHSHHSNGIAVPGSASAPSHITARDDSKDANADARTVLRVLQRRMQHKKAAAIKPL